MENKIKIVEIGKCDDLKINFINKYFVRVSPQEWDIKPEFRRNKVRYDFYFQIRCRDKKEWERICDFYIGMKKKYEKCYSHIKFFIKFIIEIEKSNDYALFYDFFIEKDENNERMRQFNHQISLMNKYLDMNIAFLFVIEIINDFKLDEMLLHNFLVIVNKCSNINCELHILQKDRSVEKANRERLRIYVANVINKDRIRFFYNNREIKTPSDNKYAKKLLPALWVDEKILDFLQNPISVENWNYLKGDCEEIHYNMDDKESECKNLLNSCKAYLFGDLYDTSSKKYSECRTNLFQNEELQKEFLSMPFLSLLIFAQYDFFYRSFLVNKYKIRIKEKRNSKKVELAERDLKLSLQKDQNYDHYDVYKSMKKEGYDIKNLFSGEDDEDIHSEIMAELFEAKTISEGLLQLIENAVFHGGGGLLSMIIYLYNSENESDSSNYHQDDNFYLEKVYSKRYLRGEKEEESDRNLEFYLEIKLSDLSTMNMKERFFENVKNTNKKDFHALVQDQFPEMQSFSSESLKYTHLFFKDDLERGDHRIYDFWEKFYSFGHNRIFHFGLQIFDSIIKSKNGIFMLSGYQEIYCDSDYLEDSYKYADSEIMGTTYQILLPLRYKYKSAQTILNISFSEGERLTLRELYDDYYTNVDGHLELKCLNLIDEIEDFLIDNKEKRKNEYHEKLGMIESLWKVIYDLLNRLDDKKCLIFIDCLHESFVESNLNMEFIIKSMLCCLLKMEKKPPVMIMGLSSYQMLECVRLLSLFYNRKGKNEGFRDIQIFLKGEKRGEQMVFVGNDLKKISINIKKTVLANGLMNDYWNVADRLINRGDLL